MKSTMFVGICAAALIAGGAMPGFAMPRAGADQPVSGSPPTEATAQSPVAPRQPEYMHIVQNSVKEGYLAEYESLQGERAKVLAAAKWPWASIGLKPMTGPSFEMLRISFFNSFEELGKEAEMLRANPTLDAKLKDIDRREAMLLQNRIEIDGHYRPAISYHGDFDWADMRFISLIKIHLIPGHGAEYTENRDIVIKAHNDSALPENLAIYTVTSGFLASSYRIFRPVISLKAFDEMDAMHGARYEGILGKEAQKKLVSLFAQSVQSEEEEYYALDSGIGYMPRTLVGRNASYWYPSSGR